jgi:hypothetical protein
MGSWPFHAVAVWWTRRMSSVCALSHQRASSTGATCARATARSPSRRARSSRPCCSSAAWATRTRCSRARASSSPICLAAVRPVRSIVSTTSSSPSESLIILPSWCYRSKSKRSFPVPGVVGVLERSYSSAKNDSGLFIGASPSQVSRVDSASSASTTGKRSAFQVGTSVLSTTITPATHSRSLANASTRTAVCADGQKFPALRPGPMLMECSHSSSTVMWPVPGRPSWAGRGVIRRRRGSSDFSSLAPRRPPSGPCPVSTTLTPTSGLSSAAA